MRPHPLRHAPPFPAIQPLPRGRIGHCHCDYHRRRRGHRAFTLVEMLVVMGIILVILASAVPIVRGVLGSRGISNSVDAISGYLTNARVVAISQNTYVVVGFYQYVAGQGGTTTGNPDDLQMVAVKSLSGTFVPLNFPSGTPSPTQLASYAPLGPIVHLPNVTLTSYAKLNPTLQAKLQYANLVPSPLSQTSATDPSTIVIPDTPANSASSTSIAFQFGPTLFNWYLIVFTPEGEALYFPESAATTNTSYTAITSPNVIPYYSSLFMGLSTSRSGTALPNDPTAAAITIDGGSGSVNVYRL